jgi:hypothetical protein
MLHMTCVALVLVTALAEVTVLRQWLQQRDLAGTQQVAAVVAFQPIHPTRN